MNLPFELRLRLHQAERQGYVLLGGKRDQLTDLWQQCRHGLPDVRLVMRQNRSRPGGVVYVVLPAGVTFSEAEQAHIETLAARYRLVRKARGQRGDYVLSAGEFKVVHAIPVFIGAVLAEAFVAFLQKAGYYARATHQSQQTDHTAADALSAGGHCD